MACRPPYSGPKSLLVIAIDIGTTYSGVSYTVLSPGTIPEICDVKGFKGQAHQASNTKVPSVLLYSYNGEIIARGAETDSDREDVVRTERFKLGLRSWTTDNYEVDLPPKYTPELAFGDFLSYMFNCVGKQIAKIDLNGDKTWSSLEGTAHFVLSHPNGWEAPQQQKMRAAAIHGGLVPNTSEGRERIEFVTEGEASFHWCIGESIPKAALKVGMHIVVADLGGGTIDVSSFRIQALEPLRLQEQAAAECSYTGSVTVTERFMSAIKPKFRGTAYMDDIEDLRNAFDSKTKCNFDGSTDPVRIPFLRRTVNVETEGLKIQNGHLHVPRENIIDAFEPSVTATVDAIKKHINGQSNARVFLVGGFAESPWMFSEIRRCLKAVGLENEVLKAEGHSAKAVAHGAVAFYLDRSVTERRMRYTYGVTLRTDYVPSDPEHQARTNKLVKDTIAGRTLIPGGFFPLVKKGELVHVEETYQKSCCSPGYQRPEAFVWNQRIQRYNGTRDKIIFIDMDPSSFEDITQFRVTLPASAMKSRKGPNGACYYAVDFKVVIHLGTVEIKAYVKWEEDSVKKETPAEIILGDHY